MAIWTTKEGTKLDIRDMETTHIENCISMLERKGFCSMKEFWASVGFARQLGGEMAQDAAHEAIAMMKPARILDELYAELARREAIREAAR